MTNRLALIYVTDICVAILFNICLDAFSYVFVIEFRLAVNAGKSLSVLINDV